MRLIELSANMRSFRTVRFNPTGLSLVVGRKSDPDDHDRARSYNGVGKSLLLYLTDFCIGAKESKELGDKLADWRFRLSFDLDGTEHEVERATNRQKFIIFDSKELKLEDFWGQTGTSLFKLTTRVKYLTYRSLMSVFIRQGKGAYLSFEQTSKNETVFTKQIRNTYLLGLDEALVSRKRELQEESQKLKDIQKQLRGDSLLREYFVGDRDAQLELQDLDEDIGRLKERIGAFRVSENYEEIEQQLHATRLRWQSVRNQLHGMRSSIKQIERSMAVQPDIAQQDVERMYQAVDRDLPELVVHRLDEVTKFHGELVASRLQRLTLEKQQIERRSAEITEELQGLEHDKDRLMDHLGSHGALQEYDALHSTLSDKKKRADRLREFQGLEEQFRTRTRENKLEMSEENIRSSEYLKASSSLVKATSDLFRSMSRRIYPELTSGLVIGNNEGKNLTRFDVEPKIQADASDGIGEAKLFCFDMVILLRHQNHSLRFLMHDSRLYAGIDPRQRYEVFRIADELTREHDCQYIATLNQDSLETMEGEMPRGEFDSLFTANTVLELTDENDASKLLGIPVDLDYSEDTRRK